MDSLLRTMKDHDPYVLRPRQAAMGVSGYRSDRNMMANWYKSDGEIIIGMLSSTLHELGMITLGYQQPQLYQKTMSQSILMPLCLPTLQRLSCKRKGNPAILPFLRTIAH